jgi:protein-L-isoaspartate O-methyltransferase
MLRTSPSRDLLEITETPVGRFLTCEHDLVLATIRNTGYWDKHLLPIFEENTNKENIVNDIGAHCGFYSIFLAKRVRKVYSIEPQRYIFAIFQRNI